MNCRMRAASSYLLQSQTGDAAATARKNLSLLPDSPTLVGIKGNLATVNAEITKLRAEVGENNPKLLNLLATKRSLESQIAHGSCRSRQGVAGPDRSSWKNSAPSSCSG